MSSGNSAVKSGETRLMPEVLHDWVYDEKVILSDDSFNLFMEMDDLLKRPVLHEFLSELKPVPFYRYMVRYLLDRCPELCDQCLEMQEILETKRAALAKAVYAEIETGGKSKKLQNRLRDKVLQIFAANGFCVDDALVRGSLTDATLHWKHGRLREVLLAETIDENKFFLLALGLGMDIEDVNIFLQKVLLRRGLDPLVPMEGILMVCLQAECADRYKLFQVLWETYKTCVQQVREEANETSRRDKTITDRTLVKAKLSAVQRKCVEALSANDCIRAEMQDYVQTVERVDWRNLPENKAFEKQIKQIKKAFGKLDKKDVRQYSDLPEGTIQVHYEAGSSLEIPVGTVFCDAVGNAIAESTKTVSTADFAMGREITFGVVSKMPIYEKFSPVEKHQVFRCGRVGCEEMRFKNKSRIKETDVGQPDEPVYLRATLTGTVIGDVEFAQGTEFWCRACKDRKKCSQNGQCETCEDAATCPNCKIITMINREPISFCYLEVPVQACEPKEGAAWPEAIPKDAIVAAKLSEEAQRVITKISHSRLNKQQRADKNASLFMEYFYGPKDIKDYVDEKDDLGEKVDLPLEEYPRLLKPFLRGMRLTDARISELKTKGYPSVKRHELLTAVFLQRAMTCYKEVPEEELESLPINLPQDGQDQSFDLQREADSVLREAGFYGIYLPNPYDVLLTYLSMCLYPAEVYRRLWGMLRLQNERRARPYDPRIDWNGQYLPLLPRTDGNRKPYCKAVD